MPIIRNTAAGPRFFNLTGGRQRTLLPGEAADLDLQVALEDDKSLQSMKDRGEIQVLKSGAKAEALQAPSYDPAALATAQDRLAEAQADVERLLGARSAAEIDTARRTPPRQFGGDGGPQQMPTVDGTAGVPTPVQGEGTLEQRVARAETVVVTNPTPKPPTPPAQPAPKRG